MPATMDTKHAKEAAELLSEVNPLVSASAFMSDLWEVLKSDRTTKMSHKAATVVSQVKYKEGGKKTGSSSLYSSLPDTPETSFVREVTDMLSQVTTRGHMTGTYGDIVKFHFLLENSK